MPKTVVRISVQTSMSFLRTSAAHTANAMKKPEVIRIAVFAVPNGMLS